MRTCSVEGCEKKYCARGLCKNHYARATRVPKPPKPRKSLEERFWPKVNKTESCWLWIGAVNNAGYGKISVNGKLEMAHRASYAMAVGPIPAGMFVDHMCHVPACVNPAHLRLATSKQNMENRSGPQSNSATGIRGVFWIASAKKWRAQVRHNGKNHICGHYTNVADAESAVIAKRNELFTHNLDRRTAA